MHVNARKIVFAALVLSGAMLISKSPAFAERFSVDSKCCGRLYYSIDPDGDVHGHYPKQEGRLSGTISGDGTATGIWIQPRSDHPCVRERRGSYAWGRFVIKNMGTPDIEGEWGYCDEAPNRAWGFR
jgi:hypothetical protein